MIEGARDMWFEEEERRPWPRWIAYPLIGLAALLCWLVSYAAFAQMGGAYSNCSQTVGASSTAVPFPASGATGPPAPTRYLMLCNAHPTQTLGVNMTGGTAAIASEGTLTVSAGGCIWRESFPIPPAITVIGSGADTPTACWYR